MCAYLEVGEVMQVDKIRSYLSNPYRRCSSWELKPMLRVGNLGHTMVQWMKALAVQAW